MMMSYGFAGVAEIIENEDGAFWRRLEGPWNGPYRSMQEARDEAITLRVSIVSCRGGVKPVGRELIGYVYTPGQALEFARVHKALAVTVERLGLSACWEPWTGVQTEVNDRLFADRYRRLVALMQDTGGMTLLGAVDRVRNAGGGAAKIVREAFSERQAHRFAWDAQARCCL